jgi:mannose-6-phosphate isomerase-like protein (cupin superfamily)
LKAAESSRWRKPQVPVREDTAVFVEAGAEHRFSAYEHLSVLVIFARGRAANP